MSLVPRAGIFPIAIADRRVSSGHLKKRREEEFVRQMQGRVDVGCVRSMGRKVSIGLAQTRAVLGDVKANIQNAVSMIRQAARMGADIVLLPELCFTGYQMELLGAKVHALSDEWRLRIDESMGAVTAECGVYAIAGLCVRDGELYYNAAHLYDRDGQRAGEYRKAFAFAAERYYFARGGEFPVFDTDFGKIGILICYDIGFPEPARYLCASGAEVVFVLAAWRAQDEHAWNLNVPSRALENQCFAAAVNHAGVFGDLRLFGRSLVCGPDGRPILQLGYDRQMVGVCTVDLDDVASLRTEPGYYVDYMASEAIGPDPRLRRGQKDV
ncbi:MAG: nitrilase-related carbon-nitrogen hydrolase [Bacillota bacterium]|jgi:predicted amidohydrolase